MKKPLMTLVGVFFLVGCGGSGVPRGDEDPPSGTAGAPSSAGGGPASDAGGPGFGGAVATGGYEAGGTDPGIAGYAGTGPGSGGYEAGGTGQGIAGYAGTGPGVGGYEAGGTGPGFGGSAGTGPYEPCSLNVARCFEAAANCYAYSPWSDCDQIVDVCSALQMSCAD